MLSDRSFAAVVNSSPVPPEQIDEKTNDRFGQPFL
jgi:hypothetical protein